jgi:predicted nucleic acid-binding protein
MTAFVVDASALGPFLIPDEVENSIPDMLDLIASDGAIAPQHWKLEIANLLRMAVRRKRMQPDALSGLVKMLGDLDIEIDDSTGQTLGAGRSFSRLSMIFRPMTRPILNSPLGLVDPWQRSMMR